MLKKKNLVKQLITTQLTPINCLFDIDFETLVNFLVRSITQVARDYPHSQVKRRSLIAFFARRSSLRILTVAWYLVILDLIGLLMFLISDLSLTYQDFLLCKMFGPPNPFGLLLICQMFIPCVPFGLLLAMYLLTFLVPTHLTHILDSTITNFQPFVIHHNIDLIIQCYLHQHYRP